MNRKSGTNDGLSRRYQNSIIGNNAVRIEREINHVQPPVKKIVRPELRQDVDFAKINKMCTFVLTFVIIFTLGICVVFLNFQLSVNQINKQIEATKKEISQYHERNELLFEEITNTADLELVYQEATTRLNMRLPGPNEVVYIENRPVSYTTMYAPVKVVDDEINFESVLGYLTRGW
ncbi:MAG: hypothetical protein JW708_04320 [Vallitaleaceae bacterium]|nr:hypothetical protein [Vallitaleaceae bacterium]